jgi:HEAT repeat protein
MLTVWWASKLRQLQQRQQDVKLARNEAALAPELSTKSLAAAPEFWQRQHNAFIYIDRQSQRLRHHLRAAGGILVLSLFADLGLIALGYGAFQTVRHWHTEQVASSYRLVAPDSYVDIYSAMENDTLRDPLFAIEQQLLYGSLDDQLNAVRQLGVIRDPGVVDMLERATEPEFIPEVRRLAIQTLGTIPDNRIPILQQLQLDSDPQVRAEAARVLASLTPTAPPVPPSAFDYRSPYFPNDMKAGKVEDSWLDRDGPHTDVSGQQLLDLYEKLGHSDSRVRQQALDDLNASLQKEPLAYHSSTIRRGLTLANIARLGQSQDSEGAIAALDRYLSEDDTTIRTAAVGALAQLGDRRAVSSLYRRLAVELDPDVRQALVAAIAKIGTAYRY